MIENLNAQKINWGEYLSEFEGSQKELLLNDPGQIERMTNEQFKEGFSDLIGTNYSPYLKSLIKKMMSELTDKQKMVLHELYWNSRTEREVAELLGMTKTGVHEVKRRAQSKIGRMLLTVSKKVNQPDENNTAA